MSVLAIVICVLAAALATLCAAADGALLGLHHPGEGSPKSGPEEERTHRVLSMARVLAYLASGAMFARGAQLATMPVWVRLIAGIVFTVAIVALAEGAGRSLGYYLGRDMLRQLAWLVRGVRFVLLPVAVIGDRIERILDLVLPRPPALAEDREPRAEQFREVVAAEADVSSAEEELLHGVFSLADTEIEEIMIPRVDIVGIDVSTPWSEVLDRVRSSEHARFPVYRETLDDIVGILYAKDLLPSVIHDEEPAGGWRALIRDATFIPTIKTLDDQLRDFKAGRIHIAIVSDEFGGTAGLVTIEDVLEEIVGEIRDEYDEEPPDVEREGDARFWVAGRVSVSELADLLDADFHIDEVTTVGGLVYELFGRVPRSGESIVYGGFRIVVERVRRRRIERVYFERLEAVGTRSEE